MKKLFLISFVVFCLATGTTNAKTQNSDRAGILPGSIFYFLDILSENIGTLLTFGDENKAQRSLNLATERLAEVEALTKRGDVKQTEKITQSYQEYLDKAVRIAERAEDTGDNVSNIQEKIKRVMTIHEDVLGTIKESFNTEVAGGGFVVVDTAQTSCHGTSSSIACPSSNEDFFGQDAQYISNTPSYTDNGNGTVTDNNTGLMWVQDAGNKTSYSSAIAMANSFTLAGYSDWRAPTIKELYSIIDFSGRDIDPTNSVGGNPFIDDEVFIFEYGDTSAGDRIIDSQWVTANKYVSTVMGGGECFFGVNFADGRIKCYPISGSRGSGYFARYVRGSSYGENNLSDNGNSTVSDRATALIWQQEDSGYGMDWESALSYCESLSLGGESDWRLPNAKELQSIVDYTRSPDTTGSPALDPVFGATPITNEAGDKDWSFYWTSTTHANQSGGGYAVYISFGRALGYMQQFGGWIDVHGAGAQRSDPKTGNSSNYPTGHGPQGDAVRVDNYVRCVSGGGAEFTTSTTLETYSPSQSARQQGDIQQQQQQGRPPFGGRQQDGQPTAQQGTPPQEAISACSSSTSGTSCSFSSPHGAVSGTCINISGVLACAPSGGPPSQTGLPQPPQ